MSGILTKILSGKMFSLKSSVAFKEKRRSVAKFLSKSRVHGLFKHPLGVYDSKQLYDANAENHMQCKNASGELREDDLADLKTAATR